MPPQAIFAATATLRRWPRRTDAREQQPGCGSAASKNIAAGIGNGAPHTREMQKGWSRACI